MAALVAVGVNRDYIECHKTPQQLFDYMGRPSSFGSAHVIVRRKHVGEMCNDLGVFLDKEKGSKVVVCNFARDRNGFNAGWLNKVTDEYAASVSTKHYEKLGRKVYRKQAQGGPIQLFVRA